MDNKLQNGLIYQTKLRELDEKIKEIIGKNKTLKNKFNSLKPYKVFWASLIILAATYATISFTVGFNLVSLVAGPVLVPLTSFGNVELREKYFKHFIKKNEIALSELEEEKEFYLDKIKDLPEYFVSKGPEEDEDYTFYKSTLLGDLRRLSACLKDLPEYQGEQSKDTNRKTI